MGRRYVPLAVRSATKARARGVTRARTRVSANIVNIRRSKTGDNAMASVAPAPELGPLGLENPMGTDGFEFVEYAAPDPQLLRDLFTKMGFPVVARHRRKNVTLHRQGDINFIINAEPDSFAQRFAA